MLTMQLRELEKDEIVSRKVYAEVPPRVEYSLTPLGRELSLIVARMGEWGDEYMRRYEEKRTRPKRKQPAA